MTPPQAPTSNMWRAALLLTLLFAGFTGLAFPAAVWGASQLLFPFQANGSLVRGADGRLLGSTLIAQSFVRPEYFHPRPSAAGAGYDGANSGGTNLGPTSAKLLDGVETGPSDQRFDGVRQLAAKYRLENGLSPSAEVPVDAVTRSGSGLDPDISPANALLQVGRVARARGVSPRAVAAMVDAAVEGRFLGVFGEPRVNVLKLNLALDAKFPAVSSLVR